ncbi:hypothetical protein [Pedobacter gandavensis]|uniref:Uncharacterized protein n=1 Tax=Pedobacter gandavensis TaxID=2679963 RepID=A0ABR6EVG4_9SPHI|nr:hypothetical protein [Pedobacter gandavensis]MBB2149269.1 hypothetical protein [Pedobacter gandavensis]
MFRNEKYKNDLTTNVGDFLDSLLGDIPVSAINSAHKIQVTCTVPVLNNGVAAVSGEFDQTNSCKE